MQDRNNFSNNSQTEQKDINSDSSKGFLRQSIQGRRHLSKWLFIILILIILVGSGGLFYYYQDGSSLQDEKTTPELQENKKTNSALQEDKKKTPVSQEGENLLGTLPDDISQNIYGHIEFSDNGRHYIFTYTQFVDKSNNEVIIFPRHKEVTDEEEFNREWLSKIREGDVITNKIVVIDGEEEVLRGSHMANVKVMGFSPKDEDNYHYAYKVKDLTLGEYYLVDGKKDGEYDKVDGFSFSSDGKHYAYVAERDSERFFVYDGVEKKSYDEMYGPILSNNGERYAYKASHDFLEGNDFYVVDGKVGPGYSIVGGFVFSPDSQDYVYYASDSESSLLIKNGNVIDSGDPGLGVKFSNITFSPDSQHMAYVKRENNKDILIKDGQKIDAVDLSTNKTISGSSYIRNLTFSPDGRHFAFTARGQVVLDGKVQSKGQNIGRRVGQLTFSPDSQRFAYKFRGGGDKVVLDGEVLERDVKERSSFVDYLTFSPDSKHFIYVAYDLSRTNSKLNYSGIHNVFVDNVAVGQTYDTVHNVRFNESGDLAFNAVKDDNILNVVIDLD